jgi:hypothetical protein
VDGARADDHEHPVIVAGKNVGSVVASRSDCALGVLGGSYLVSEQSRLDEGIVLART